MTIAATTLHRAIVRKMVPTRVNIVVPLVVEVRCLTILYMGQVSRYGSTRRRFGHVHLRNASQLP